MTCNPAGVANTAMTTLLTGEDLSFTLPDLSSVTFPTLPDLPVLPDPERIDVGTLTDRVVGGAGIFDVIMDAVKAHLVVEYEANRISGVEYARVYTAAIEAALGNATQILLNKDQAYWQALAARQQAYIAQAQFATSKVTFETAKAEMVLAGFRAKTVRAEYAGAKMQLAIQSTSYCTSEYNLLEMLPLQKAQLTAQNSQISAQTTLITAQKLQVDKEVQKSTAEISLIDANTTNALAQTAVITNQATLVKEQSEAQRAQTLDTRSDSLPVTGAIGKQKALQTQQITSYQQDAAVKGAKFWVDGFTVQKTMDESLTPPTEFTAANISSVLTKLKTVTQLN